MSNSDKSKKEIYFFIMNPTHLFFDEEYTGSTKHSTIVSIKYEEKTNCGIFADITIQIDKYGGEKELNKTVEIDFVYERYIYERVAYDIMHMLKKEDPDYLYAYELDKVILMINKLWGE